MGHQIVKLLMSFIDQGIVGGKRSLIRKKEDHNS